MNRDDQRLYTISFVLILIALLTMLVGIATWIAVRSADFESFGAKEESIASAAYSKIADTSNNDEKDAYYLIAIQNDPSNTRYFNDYLDFLQDIDAPYAYYYDFYFMLGDMLYDTTAENVPTILGYMDVVEGLMGEMDSKGDTSGLSAAWDTVYSEYLAFADMSAFDYDQFSDVVGLLDSIYTASSSPSDEMTQQFSDVLYVSAFADGYVSVANMRDQLKSVSLEQLELLYSSFSNTANAVLSEFLTRNVADDGVFSDLISSWQKAIMGCIVEVTSYYEALLTQKADELLNADFNDMSLGERYDFINHNQSLFLTLSTIETTDEAEGVIGRFNSLQEDFQRALYSLYQYWTAMELEKIDEAVSDAKKGRKLEALFSSGYFNINQDLLIPQLVTWYASLYTEDIREDSDYAFSDLQKEYPIVYVGIEDML